MFLQGGFLLPFSPLKFGCFLYCNYLVVIIKPTIYYLLANKVFPRCSGFSSGPILSLEWPVLHYSSHWAGLCYTAQRNRTWEWADQPPQYTALYTTLFQNKALSNIVLWLTIQQLLEEFLSQYSIKNNSLFNTIHDIQWNMKCVITVTFLHD